MARVFISYSHKDEAWKDRVVRQLGVLAGQGLSVWDDRRIAGGDDWQPEIEQAIDGCDVALPVDAYPLAQPYPGPARGRQAAYRHD